jgi:hypothetical protein
VQTLGQVSGWLSRKVDEDALNGGFDAGCAGTQASGNWLSRLQNGRAPRYLRLVAVGMALLTLGLILGRNAG